MAIAQANGVNLYYEVHGGGDPVVLVHGLGPTHDMGSGARGLGCILSSAGVRQFCSTYRAMPLHIAHPNPLSLLGLTNTAI